VTRILAISGSLRERSYNRALLRAARELAPAGIEIEEYDISPLPFYDGDVEAAGDPEPVSALRAAVAEADALLIATPEYNRGTSGVLKNAIDWLSRPALASVLRWKPVAVIGASTGRGGTRRAQQQVRDALLFPGAIVIEEPEVALPVAWEHFDEDGRLVDEKTRDSIRALLEGLAAAPRAQQASRPSRSEFGLRRPVISDGRTGQARAS
jgi:chromate reductase, NAD(P)H dehydrogenase (quinone)